MRYKTLTDNIINNENEKTLQSFMKLLVTGVVEIGISYVQNPETKLLTHQYLVVTCGDRQTMSAPEELTPPLAIMDTVH